MNSDSDNQKLLESEEKFRALAETSPTAILIYQKDKILYTNPAIELITGFPKKELLAMKFWELVHPDDMEKIKANGYARLENNYVPQRYEFKILTKDKITKWVDFSAGVIEYSGKIAAIGVAIDITDRKNAELSLKKRNEDIAIQNDEFRSLNDEYLAINEELKEANDILFQTNQKLADSEERFRAIFEYSNNAFRIFKDNKTVLVNSAFLKMFGYEINENLTGTSITNIVAPHNRDIFTNEIKKHISGKNKTASFEFIGIKKNGEELYIENTPYSITFNNEKYTVGFLKDVTESKKIEKKLTESEEKYHILFDSSSEGFFIMSKTIYDCNQKACEIFGYTKEEIIGKNPAELSPVFQPDGKKSIDSANEKIKNTLNNVPQNFYWKHKRKDNTLIDCDISLKAMHLNNEIFIIATIRDITAKLKSELKLKENERKLSEVYQIAKLGSWLLDVENKEITLSKEHQLLIGIDSLSALPVSMSLTDFATKYIVPEDIPFILKQFQIAINNGPVPTNTTPEPFEYRLIHSSGEIRIMTVHAKMFEKGIVYGVTQDNTDRKNTEQQLKSTDLLLKGINNSANILLTEKDFLTGIRKSFDIIGKTTNISKVCIYECISDEKGDHHLFQKFERTNDSFVSNNPEWQNISALKCGIERWITVLNSGENINGTTKDFPFKEQLFLEQLGTLSILIIPIKIEMKFWGFICFEDTLKSRIWTSSEEKILVNLANSIGGAIANQLRSEEIIRSREKAMESDRLKTAFLANMSHEIRTPMNAILGFTELLKDDDLPKYKRNEFIDIISKRGKDLLNIINDIIDISKIEAGQIKINPVECSLNTLILELYSFFESDITLKEKNEVTLRVKTSLVMADSFVFIDDFRIKQVFMNLIGNAVKFTEKGYIEFGYYQEGNYLKFYVEDTGIGISQEKQSLIFDRFRQADDSTTKFYGGTGLGLAISKSLVELMDGYITLESDISGGSRFSFYIPFKPAKKQAIKPAGDKPESVKEVNWKSKKILIVEDDNINFQYLRVLLKKTHAQIVRAENGLEAIDICKEDKDIDLILMDMQMPVMNGFEATKIIKEFKPELPIIAQTAYAMAEDKEKCLAAGCDDYLTKPIDIKILISVTGKYFSN